MKIAIKGAIILLVASLVVMAVGCGEEEGNVIKIGVKVARALKTN